MNRLRPPSMVPYSTGGSSVALTVKAYSRLGAGAAEPRAPISSNPAGSVSMARNKVFVAAPAIRRQTASVKARSDGR